MNVTTIPLLEDLKGPWSALTIRLIGPTATGGGADETITLGDVYPFTSVNDLKRMLWYQKGGDPRWAPERVFLGVRSPSGTGYRPIEFHWPAAATAGGVDLLDPVPTANRTPSAALVDETGNRLPVTPTMIGSLILETALSPEIIANAGALPEVTAIALAALQPPTGEPEALTAALYGGFYQLYFPWLTAPAQVLDAAATAPTAQDREAYGATIPYLEDRAGRIAIVQRALATRAGGSVATMTTVVRMRWTLPSPAAKPESLEKTFYSLRASAAIPFLRYFPIGGKGAPLLKLALKADGSPVLDNDKVIAQYLSQAAPVMKSAVILARAPFASDHTERGAAFTVFMFEDGTVDITLEVPQRGMKYIAAVATDAQRLLRELLTELGFAPTVDPHLRDLHATYRWVHPNPRKSAPLSTARLQSRVAALTPFLESAPTSAVPDATTGQAALASFKWRAVSNYESESAQFEFITQLVLAGGGEEEGDEALAQYITALTERFSLTPEAAAATLERWTERRKRAVAPAVGPLAGTLAVPAHNTGTFVTVGGTHPEYTIEVQGAESFEELQRILSVVGVLLGAASADLALSKPAPVVEAVTTVVELADAAVVSAATASGGGAAMALGGGGDLEVGELDPAMADMLGDIDFGLDDFGVGDEEEVVAEVLEGTGGGGGAAPTLVVAETAAATAIGAEAVAAPNLEAAMAGVEEECRGTRWTPGEPALRIPADYYMVRLKRNDNVLFGYPTKGKIKGYSKTCQRQDERQPNILTLAEYARVRRCYRDRVRFVDLPPRAPTDLPDIPGYNPKKKKTLPDEVFVTDPATGLPMWIVYGYESKTTPGEFLYLMCAELWCERDNLPLLRSEFEGTSAGRGFAKEANTCPFCGGRAIAVFDSPQPGESVIVRLPKEATGKVHSFVGTIRVKDKHPQGFPLPCCDTTPRLLKSYLEAKFAGTIVYGRDLAAFDEEAAAAVADAGLGAAAAVEDEVAEPPPEMAVAAATGVGDEEGEDIDIDYAKILSSMPTQYILGADKILDAGKLGLLPAALDAFFGQDGTRSMERRGIRPTFAEGANLFVRLGVDNRGRTAGMNLFAALAPLMGYHSAAHARREIIRQRFVRAFESANYGTLVAEFAAKSTLSDREIDASLPAFAAEYAYELGPNRPHVIRLYKAWVTFLAYLADKRVPKQLRHLEHILAQPGVLSPRGLLFVVLEWNPQTERIDVVCPSFGIPTASIFGDVPVAFLWHSRRDESWEPLVLYNGSRDAVRFFGERAADLELLPRPLRTSLQQWLRDWRSSSLGCGRPAAPPHVWTPERDTRPLPRLSQMRSLVRGATPTKLVRDRSNRLAGVLMSTGSAAATPLFAPCLDDGALMDQTPRVFEAEMIPPAPLETYLRFYDEISIAALKPVAVLAKMEDATQIVGFRTQVGTMVPTAPAPVASAPPGLPVEQLDAFPWERDALILRSPDAAAMAGVALEEQTANPEQQLAEAYQLLRLSLSKWLIRDARGPAMRRDLAKLLAAGIPLYEKRKRMDIVLEPILREWIAPEQTEARASLALLRKDCLAITEEGQCDGACRWSDGRCLIHAPFRAPGTDPVRIFTARLSDELLRYSAQRREILDETVPAIRTPRGVLRVGDELYMATGPKEGPQAILSRLGFTGQQTAAFPEEMMRFADLEEEEEAVVAAAEAEAVAPTTLPPAWLEKGFELPTPAPSLSVDEARRLVLAGATGRDVEEWETYIKDRRKKLGLAGDTTRPFQWSVQDFYVMTRLTTSNIVFAHAGADGRTVIDRWIQPATGAVKVAQPLYMIFWGPRQLLLSKGKSYRFYGRDLPADFMTAIDGASPMAEEEARGSVEDPVGAVEVAVAVAGGGAGVSSSSSEEVVVEGVAGGGGGAAQMRPPQPAAKLDSEEGQTRPPQPAPMLAPVTAVAAAVSQESEGPPPPALVVAEVAEGKEGDA